MTTRTNSILAGMVLAGAAVALWLPDPIAAYERLEICSPHYARSQRLPAASYYPIAQEAYRRAGIPWSARGAYRLDHIVPLCLGGTWDQSNLQVQTIAEAAEKDDLERAACRLVCEGRETLGSEQRYFESGAWRADLSK